MKIKVNIKQVAISRGIKTAYQLQKKVGLSPSNASRLYNNKIKQISVITLGKLCDVLGCEPSDLFVRKKSRKKSKD
jgi:putative transcriptional regulator